MAIEQIQLDYEQNSISFEYQQMLSEVIETVGAYNRLQRELELADQVQNLAIERFEISRQSFVLGAISTTELTIAQSEKDLAIQNYLQTLAAYWTVYYRLRLQTLYDFINNEKITYSL